MPTSVPSTVQSASWEAETQRRLLRREHDALADCYDQFGPLVYTVALRTTGSRSAAEEVTQEVFLTLWSKAVAVDLTRGTMRAWLGRVAHNRGVDWNRREAAHERRGQQPPTTAPMPDVSEMLDAAVGAEQVRTALDALPDDQATAIRLAYFGPMTYRCVAAELDIPEGTVKSRIRCGLRRMATTLLRSTDERVRL